jgi:type I restriction enzyme S subunit
VLTEANGYTRINLKIDKINEIPLKTPPTLDEQISIAKYLDQKTSEVDELIMQKEELLLLFEEEKTAIINHAVTKGIDHNAKLKDSKIEWIGHIPEHWEIKKLKLIGDIFGRIGYRGYTTSDLVIEGQGAITLSPSNMKDYYMDFEKCSFISWEKYEESPEIKIFDGDILFVKTGSTFGKVAFVKDLPEKATINPQIIVIKNIKCNNYFLFYFLKSNLAKFQVDTTVVGGTIPTISQDKISNYYLLIPPIEEQNNLVKHIEDEFIRIDCQINNTKILINQLKEYKTALITEVATGKVKVI